MTTVLIVDDSPTALRLTTELVASEGLKIITATDGLEAVARAQACQPEIVILDIILPKQNGYEVCRQLRQDPRTAATRILMLTSKGLDEERLWGLQQGADQYFTKPYSADELRQTLRHWTAETTSRTGS